MKYCLALCSLLVAFSCKAPEYYYQSQRHQPLNFYRQMLGTIDGASKNIDSIQVYEATLQARLTSRNNVGEQTMVNKESGQELIAYPGTWYEHRLYLFRIYSESPVDDEVIFMQTTFRGLCYQGNGDPTRFDGSNCKNMGIGPAYYGKIRSNQLSMSNQLVMNKKRDLYQPVKSVPYNMRFMMRDGMSKRVPQNIFIEELLLTDNNKVGGSKPLRYQLTNLFADSSAFKFRYTTTLTNSTP